MQVDLYEGRKTVVGFGVVIGGGVRSPRLPYFVF